MIYRKSPPTPPRLLLRIVATAGAGTLFAVAACSSHGTHGLVADAPSDASDTDAAPNFGGFVVNPDAAMLVGVTGVAPSIEPDASDGGVRDDAGAATEPDGPADATDDVTSDAAGPCHPCGVVVFQDQ